MAEGITRLTHETYVNDNPPDTSQLFKLASYAMVSAEATNTHKVMTRSPRTHFSVQEVGYLNEVAPLVFDDYPAEARRRMAIRIGRQTLDGMPMKSWSMKFFDTNWYERPGGNWEGVRDLYRFEWNRGGVTLADKTSKMVSSNRDVMYERDMYTDLERFYIPDDAAAIVTAQHELTQVTADDCDLLLENVRDYYDNNPLRNRPAA